jgi:hypothetical protein
LRRWVRRPRRPRFDRPPPGSIGSTPAVQNAIIDAVAHLGVRHIDMPASPQRVWQALESAASV